MATQADIDFAEEMIATLRQRIREGAGFTEMSIDGQTVKLSDLKAELAYWQKQHQTLTSTGGRVVQPLDLSTL